MLNEDLQASLNIPKANQQQSWWNINCVDEPANGVEEFKVRVHLYGYG